MLSLRVSVVTGNLLAGMLGLSACQHAPPPTPAAALASAQWTDGWLPFVLPGKTATNYTARMADGRWVLHAQSRTSASLYRRSLRIEPERLGKLSFSWKADALPAGADVRQGDSEDAVVRVLLAFDGDAAALTPRTRMMFDLMQSLTGEAPPFATLMYVWDSRAEVGSVVLNPRSDRIRKIVLESGPQHAGQWRSYVRDVRADYRRAFGEEPGPLIGLAVMTDSDNTRSTAEAWYGEIRLQ
ncbi:MAG TPA: DUF3047 domain-containing protein [Rubrivivax sp.]|nr:DUF3047 domain-containing protein [Rubrivivax sp.]